MDLNCKPRVYSGGGRDSGGSGFDQPLRGMSAKMVLIPQKIQLVGHWEWTARMATPFIARNQLG